MAIQPPAIRAVIRAFVPAIAALTVEMVALAAFFVASATPFAVALAACAAFCAVLAEAAAAACAVLAVCSVVLIAVLEVACAVFTPFSAVLIVPFAVDFTFFSTFRAVVLTVFFPCRLVFISGFSAVWGASEFMPAGLSGAGERRTAAGGEGNQLIAIFGGHARIIQGKLLAFPDIGVKFFLILRIHKVIVAVAFCTVRHSLKYGDDFIFRLLRKGVKLDSPVSLIKALSLVIHLLTLDVMTVDNQVVTRKDVAVFLDIWHAQIAVFLFKIVLQNR